MPTYKVKLNRLFLLIVLCNTTIIFSQVGINTTSPRKTLEVAGDMKISESIDIGSLQPLDDNDISTFLIQDENESLKSLDVSNPTGAALAYIQEYYIVNPNLDWVKEFDTEVDKDDYIMIITSASFNLELDISNNGNGPETNFSLPYATTFIKGDSWHIRADYPQAANVDESAIGTWTISTLIFSNDIGKQFGTMTLNMAGTSTGSAVTPIVN